jgi:hypothetical protein
MADKSASIGRAAALWRAAYLAKAVSIGLKSGE